MNRSSTVKRLYPTERYGNIEFTDRLDDIPEEVCLNKDLLEGIRYLQMISMELAFRRYLDLIEKVHTVEAAEILAGINYLKSEQESVTEYIESLLLKSKETK